MYVAFWLYTGDNTNAHYIIHPSWCRYAARCTGSGLQYFNGSDYVNYPDNDLNFAINTWVYIECIFDGEYTGGRFNVAVDGTWGGWVTDGYDSFSTCGDFRMYPGGGANAFIDDFVVSYWKDSTSNACDAYAGGGSNGIPTATSKIGQGAQLDGLIDYFSVSNTETELDVADGDFAISAWVKPTNVALGLQTIMGKATFSSGHDEYGLFIRGTGTYATQIRDSTSAGKLSESNDSATDDTWTHLVGVRNSNTLYLYRNGDVQTDTEDVTGVSPDTSSLDFEIGRGSEDAKYELEGYVDELRIYDGTMSSDWIATEYANQNSPSTFATCSDAGATSVQYTETPSDSISIAESLANKITLKISDTQSIIEDLTTKSEIKLSIDDTLDISEDISLSSGIKNTIFDSISITESLSIINSFKLSLDDNCSIVEDISTRTGLEISRSDSIDITEDVSKVLNLVVSDFYSLEESEGKEIVKTLR